MGARARSDRQRLLKADLLRISRPGVYDVADAADKIASRNARIRRYAEKNSFEYVDYYGAMVSGEKRELDPRYQTDSVHPNEAGYDVMEPLVQKAIKRVL